MKPTVPPEPAPPTPATELGRAVADVQRDYPLLRCKHDKALRDHAGNRLEPSCGCRAPAAAPPTVAPARPNLTAREFARWYVTREEMWPTEQEREDKLTKFVDERDRAWQFPRDRDRASRSPGVGVDETQRVRDLEGALAGLINGVEFGLRRYAETGDGLIAAALERAREAMSWLSPSAGQKGTEEP